MNTKESQTNTAVIYDDHRFFGEVFKQLLEITGVFKEVHYFSSEQKILDFCRENCKTKLWLFLDFFLEKGNVLYLVSELQKLQADLKIIIVSSVDNPILIKKILYHKVDGFISKIDGIEVIKDCVSAFSQKEKYISPTINEVLGNDNSNQEFEEFTTRELEVISMLACGESTGNIADKLNLSVHTIMTHRKNIMAKVGATNISQVIVYALRVGLIENA